MSRTGIYDIHCHIVPGVDDGASDYEDTKKLLRMEYDQGVRNIIATPHFRFRMFETPLSRVQEQFLLVQKAAAEIAERGRGQHHGRFQVCAGGVFGEFRGLLHKGKAEQVDFQWL